MGLSEVLEALHTEVAEQLLTKIQSGEATHQEINSALRLLQQNNIQCEITPTNPLGHLKDELEGARDNIAQFIPR